MRQIVVAEYLSLDGVGEDPGRIGAFEHRGWIIPYYDEELATYMSDQLAANDALLLGRTTYEGFVTVWPARSGDPIGDRMNSLPKLVASTRLKEPLDWNATLLEGDVADEVRKLKKQPGGNILIYGSGRLVHTLMQLDLIDAFQLMLVPITLGRGERFFKDGRDPTTLSLTDVKTTGAGVVMLTYQRPPNDGDRSAGAEEISGDWWLRRRQLENEQG
ncbi:MAG: dihydrofolate reductase family protein [Candidatus Rokuibacteriota bacterium]